MSEKKIDKICFFWDRNKDCRRGETCHFVHGETSSGIVADPPKKWVEYGDDIPPKHISTRATTASSESSKDRDQKSSPIEEDDWEKAIQAGDRWDRPSSSAIRNGWRESVTEDNWKESHPDPYHSKANTPVAAFGHRLQLSSASSTSPNRRPSSVTASNTNYGRASVAASAAPTDYDDSPSVIEDIWETLLPPDFAKYTALKRTYGTSDSEFEIDTLVVLLSANPFRLLDVEQYLNSYPKDQVLQTINATSSYEKITSLFFAVATNEPKALKLLIDKGGDVNSTAGIDSIPVLAFAIMHGSKVDTTEIVRILLAYGADSAVLPDEFTTLDQHSLNPRTAPRASLASSSVQWCSEKYRAKLVSTINLTQRYWLARSRRQHSQTAREISVARKEKCQKLFQIPYSLIGQEFATGILMKRVLSHVLLSKSSTKPLVVVLAGASGHGKTELAKCMGELLSVESLAIDSTEMNHKTDLFGPKAPFPSYEEGSALNNFLCHNHGQRSVVFLDNFEKMGPNVSDSLLIPFGEGKYHDHRTARTDAEIDCSKVIWILATSNVDNIIEPYYRANIDTLQDNDPLNEQDVVDLMKEIETKFLKRLCTQFGAIFAGRISLVLPFFPFSPTEQAVVAHKYVLELKKTLAADIDVDNEVLMGHIKLEIEEESVVCRMMAQKGYKVNYGARSIEREVQKTVHDAIAQEWLKSSDDITNQSNDGPYECYSLAIHSSGEFIHVRSITGKKGKGKANGLKGRQNGGIRNFGVSSPGSSAERSGTPFGVKKSLAKVGRLIDIGGEFVKPGWEE